MCTTWRDAAKTKKILVPKSDYHIQLPEVAYFEPGHNFEWKIHLFLFDFPLLQNITISGCYNLEQDLLGWWQDCHYLKSLDMLPCSVSPTSITKWEYKQLESTKVHSRSSEPPLLLQIRRNFMGNTESHSKRQSYWTKVFRKASYRAGPAKIVYLHVRYVQSTTSK